MAETDRSKRENMLDSRGSIDSLPPDLAAECREISREISQEKETVREAKIIAARIRMETGYYNSDNVLRIVASRLLDESQKD
jgi:hypothetical protein